MGFGASSTTASTAGTGLRDILQGRDRRWVINLGQVLSSTFGGGVTSDFALVWKRLTKRPKSLRPRFVLRFSFSFFSSCRVIRGEARRYYDMKQNTNTLTSLTSGASSAGLASAVTRAVSVTATAVSLISMLVENKATKRAYTVGSAGASGAGAGAGASSVGASLTGSSVCNWGRDDKNYDKGGSTLTNSFFSSVRGLLGISIFFSDLAMSLN
jgi:hypothetical protein